MDSQTFQNISKKKSRSTKNGLWASSFNLFNSTLGLGLMNAQFYFHKSGWLLSPILVCLIVGTILYNMLLLSEIANSLQSIIFYYVCSFNLKFLLFNSNIFFKN